MAASIVLVIKNSVLNIHPFKRMRGRTATTGQSLFPLFDFSGRIATEYTFWTKALFFT
jgi:hypothetical protein